MIHEEIARAGAYLVPTMVTYEAIWREGKDYGIGDYQLHKISIAREKSVDLYGCPAGGCLLTDPLIARRVRDEAIP